MALPDTAPVLEQTMHKLATTPYRMLQKGRSIGTNDYAAVIRPILDDLLHAESAMRRCSGPANHVPELLLAVRLDQHREIRVLADQSGNHVLTAWTGIPVVKIQAEGVSQGWGVEKSTTTQTASGFFRPVIGRCLAGGRMIFSCNQACCNESRAADVQFPC